VDPEEHREYAHLRAGDDGHRSEKPLHESREEIKYSLVRIVPERWDLAGSETGNMCM
jgi:hypothetical protein